MLKPTFDPIALRIWPTANDVPADIRHFQDDVCGDGAITAAAADLLAGKPVRFARVRRMESTSPGEPGCWILLNVVRFQREKASRARKAKGYGDQIRLHDADGDVFGDNSCALHCYRADDIASVAVALVQYLIIRDASFRRLLP